MTRRQLTIKPTCTREIAAFPSDRAALRWDKIDINHWHVDSAS